MRIRNQQDFWAGIIFVGTGLLFAAFAIKLQIGTAARMGPGYFPLLLGSLLALLGLIVILRALGSSGRESRLGSIGWREILFVLGAVALFAASLSSLGIVCATVLLIVTAAYAGHEFSWKETILLALVLVVLAYLVFVRGLNLPFPLWPTLLTS